MGSKSGWIVAGVLVVVIGTFVGYNIWKSFADPDPSDPTSATTGAGALDFKENKADPTLIIPARPTAAGNAADDYVKAIAIYKANKDKLKSLLSAEAIDDVWRSKKKLMDGEVELLKQIDQLVAAGTAKEKMEFTLVHTPKEFRVGWVYRPGDELQRVVQCEELLAGDCYARKESDASIQALQRMFVMGLHMLDERTRAYITFLGMNNINQAIGRLSMNYGPMGPSADTKFKNLEKYLTQFTPFSQSFTTKSAIVNPGKMDPGDIFNVVGSAQDPDKFKGDKDHAWRVQGILDLGKLKFGSMKITEREPGEAARQAEADRKYAQKLINQFLTSQDPADLAAAKAAEAFTKADLGNLLTEEAAEE